MKRLKRGFVVALFALLAQMLQAQPSAPENWAEGWAEFDPENAEY